MGADSEGVVSEAPEALQLRQVVLNDLPHVWDQVEPLLARACAYSAGEMTPAAVADGMGASDGVARLQMLAMVRGREITSVMVTQVTMYPTPEGPWVRKLDCLLVSGSEVDAWLPFEPDMDVWARGMGCVAVRIPRARIGWSRVLERAGTGWEQRSGKVCVMEREI